MKKLHALIFTLCLAQGSTMHGFFSFKKITSWIYRYKQEPVYEQHPFDLEGEVEAFNNLGSINVKTWDQPQLAVKATKLGKEKYLETANVKVCIDGTRASIKTVDENNKTSIDVSLIIPRTCKLTANTKHHDISVKQVAGSINASTESGRIDLKECSQSLSASAQSGSVQASFISLTPETEINLQTKTGSISLALPQQANAILEAHTQTGSVSSAHPVTLESRSMRLNTRAWERAKKNIVGTMGDGGALIALHSTKGSIRIS